MPLYEYRCPNGHLTDAYRTVEDRATPEPCRCGELAQKVIRTAAFAVPDIGGYKSIIDGRWIGSRTAHREHLKVHGAVEVGNERMPERKPIEPTGVREDIHRAIEEIKSR